MKRYILLSILALALFTLTGCVSFPNFSTVSEYREHIPIEENARFSVGRIDVYFPDDPEKLRQVINYAATMELQKLSNSSRNGGNAAGKEYILHFQMDQREIIKDFRPLNAVTVAMQVIPAGENTPIGRYLFAEETENTLGSTAYVYKIVGKAVRTVYP